MPTRAEVNTDVDEKIRDKTSLDKVDNVDDANNRDLILDYVDQEIATRQPTITAATSADYYRGDKTFATLNKTAVGLANVDNTSDINKPVSTAQQTAIDLVALPYKSYVATLNQSGTSNPTVSLLDNDMSGVIVWARTGVGVYTGTLTGAFTLNKCWNMPSNIVVNASVVGVLTQSVSVYRESANVYKIETYFEGSSSDGVLQNFNLEIRVYN